MSGVGVGRMRLTLWAKARRCDLCAGGVRERRCVMNDRMRMTSVLARAWKDRAMAEKFVKERAEAAYKQKLQDAAGKVNVVR